MDDLKAVAAKLRESLDQQEKNIQQEQNSPTTNCAKCEDTGYIVTNGKAVQCECVLEKRVTARLPERFRASSLLDFNEQIRAFVLSWLANPGDGLFIHGPAGTGKTHLAAAITRTITLVGREAYFKRCATLYASLRDSYRTNTSEESVLKDYVDQRFVILDDIGAGSLSDFERRSVLEIFDRRINRQLPTVVTSNWELSEISDRLDDRIASRLASFVTIRLGGKDRRAEK